VLPYNHTQIQAQSTHVFSWKMKLVEHGCLLQSVTLYSGKYRLCWCLHLAVQARKSQYKNWFCLTCPM